MILLFILLGDLLVTVAQAIEVGFEPRQAAAIDLPPYHCGVTFGNRSAPPQEG